MNGMGNAGVSEKVILERFDKTGKLLQRNTVNSGHVVVERFDMEAEKI